jgi:protein TonB
MNKSVQGGYLDIVFAHRNKAYGAYEMRKNYNKRMILAGIIMCLSVLAFGWTLNATNKAAVLGEPIIEKSLPFDIKEVVFEEEVLQPPVEEIIEQTGRTAATQHYDVPNIVADNNTTNDILTPIKDDALAGPVNNEGLQDGTAIALDNSIHEGTGEPNDNTLSRAGAKEGTETTNTEELNQPLKFASEKAEFPGGEAALKLFLNNNLKYPKQAQEDGITGTVIITFIVNTDGSIVDIKAPRKLPGGCTEEAIRVVGSMPKWKPAKHNGRNVRLKMSLPIKFVLDN